MCRWISALYLFHSIMMVNRLWIESGIKLSSGFFIWTTKYKGHFGDDWSLEGIYNSKYSCLTKSQKLPTKDPHTMHWNIFIVLFICSTTFLSFFNILLVILSVPSILTILVCCISVPSILTILVCCIKLQTPPSNCSKYDPIYSMVGFPVVPYRLGNRQVQLEEIQDLNVVLYNKMHIFNLH